MTPRERIEALESSHRKSAEWGGVWATGDDIAWLLAVARAAVAFAESPSIANRNDLFNAVDGDSTKEVNP